MITDTEIKLKGFQALATSLVNKFDYCSKISNRNLYPLELTRWLAICYLHY